jgi:hypothetical protein
VPVVHALRQVFAVFTATTHHAKYTLVSPQAREVWVNVSLSLWLLDEVRAQDTRVTVSADEEAQAMVFQPGNLLRRPSIAGELLDFLRC